MIAKNRKYSLSPPVTLYLERIKQKSRSGTKGVQGKTLGLGLTYVSTNWNDIIKANHKRMT